MSTLRLNHSIYLDLHQPLRINKARHLHHRIHRAHIAKKLAMHITHRFPILYPRQQNTGANDILQARSRLLKRVARNLKTTACLRGASPTPTVLPSGPMGAVPATATIFPIRTAREMPRRGSYGEPLDTFCRVMLYYTPISLFVSLRL